VDHYILNVGTVENELEEKCSVQSFLFICKNLSEFCLYLLFTYAETQSVSKWKERNADEDETPSRSFAKGRGRSNGKPRNITGIEAS
jgi:hypothetical protein